MVMLVAPPGTIVEAWTRTSIAIKQQTVQPTMNTTTAQRGMREARTTTATVILATAATAIAISRRMAMQIQQQVITVRRSQTAIVAIATINNNNNNMGQRTSTVSRTKDVNVLPK